MIMAYETLLYETEGEIGILTYNRPRVVNAINKKMIDELTDFWLEQHRDFDTRVIIIRGAGEKGFCSGVDLKSASSEFTGEGGVPTPESIFNGQNQFSNIIRLMRTCPQPIIAAVHGPAMGAGMSFALAADVRLASEEAFFNAHAVKNELRPQSAAVLPSRVRQRRGGFGDHLESNGGEGRGMLEH